MWRRAAILLVSCLRLAACSRLTSSDDPYHDFHEAVLQANTDRNAALAGRVAHPYDITGQVSDQLDRLKSALDSRTYYNAVSELKNIVSQFSDNASVQESGQALLDQIKSEEKVDLAALATHFASAQKLESDALTTAEKPEDLDATLQALATLEKEVGRCGAYDGRRVTAYRDFLQTRRYVSKWQDYLLARNSANPREAFRDLRYLTIINQIGLPVPRSQLIDRLAVLDRENPLPVSFTAYPPPAAPNTNAAPSGK